MRRIASLLLAGALLAPSHGLVAETTVTERASAQQAFRVAFDAGSYPQALPLARRVVELTSTRFGTESIELATPLINLATTLLRMKRLDEAFDQYSRAFELLEEQTHPVDARRIAPMQGIAAVLQAADRHEDAIVVLEEAIDVVRASEGFDSPAQFPLQWSLVESYEKTHRRQDADRIRLHIFHTAERAFGADDVRMVGPLCDLAEWYEKYGRHSGARVIYLRAVQLADRHEPGNLDAIRPLRGLARTYRNKRLFDEAGVASTMSELPRSVARAGLPNFNAAPAEEGQRALQNAVQRLEATGEDGALERGQLLVELGDLHHLFGSPSRAMEAWSEAWGELSRGGDTSLLDQPALIRKASGKASGRGSLTRSPSAWLREWVLLRLSVTAAGDVHDVAVVLPHLNEKRDREVTDRVGDYTFRPAFAAGKPVAWKDFVYQEVMYIPEGSLKTGVAGSSR